MGGFAKGDNLPFYSDKRFCKAEPHLVQTLVHNVDKYPAENFLHRGGEGGLCVL